MSDAALRRFAFYGFVLFLGTLLLHRIHDVLNFADFSAFYCGGAALREHLDPYQASSLHVCESRLIGFFGHPLFQGLTIPAPLPPFDLAFFALLSLLPMGAACSLWLAMTSLAYGMTVLLLRRMSGLSPFAIGAVTALPMLRLAFPMGQVTGLVFLFLVLAADQWRKGRPRAAAVCALGTLATPSIALPVCSALFLLERSARLPLLAGVLPAVLIDVTVMPIDATSTYLHTLLPAHALAEVHQDAQYSLSHLLGLLGVPPKIAVVAGSFDYLFMLVVGLFLASRLATSPRRRDLALFVAPTAAMFGGSFVHIQELSVALFTSILIYREIAGGDLVARRARMAIFGCMLALALPMMDIITMEDLVLDVGMAALLALSLLKISTKHLCILVGCIGLTLDGAVRLLSMRLAYVVPVDRLNAVLDSALRQGLPLEDLWRLYVDHHLAWIGWVSGLLELPVWLSLALLLTAAASLTGHVRLPRLFRPESE